MTTLADNIEDYLADPPVALDDPVDAITGISAALAEEYADPDASPTGYYGDGAVVETVGDLVCSDATVRAAPNQFRTDAALDVLAARADPESLAAYCEPFVPEDFDGDELTREDVALQRYVTGFGGSPALHDREERETTIAAVRDFDRRGAYHWQASAVWRPDHDPTFDPGALVEPRAVSDRLGMHERDAALYTTADSVAALAEQDERAAATTTRLTADLVAVASLLFRTNYARAENLGGVRIADGAGAPDCDFRSQPENGVVWVATAPNHDLTVGFADRGRNDDALVARLVDEQVV